MTSNPMEFIFQLFERFQSFTEVCKEFLFTEINVLDTTLSVWEFLGGGLLITVLVIIIVKLVI